MSKTKARTPKKQCSARAAAAQPRDEATEYARRVVAGDIVAGPMVRAACKRHLDDLKHGRERGLTWDVAAAERAIRFFRDWLKLNGGDFEGVPFDPQPWQCFIIGNLFGWMGPDGYRRFRTAYVEIGKGNGKSPLVAGIGLYMLMCDGEARAEVYAAATKKDQAAILFRDAVAMVDQSPAIKKRLLKTPNNEKCWNLTHRESGSWFRTISSDDGQSGPRPHCSLIDEVHEHKTSEVIDMMRLGAKGRTQPLMVMITNSGVDRTTVCWQYHEYAGEIFGGRIPAADADTTFAYVCGLDEKDDPFVDEKCWPKANPNLGVSIKDTYLRQMVAEARGMPAKASKILRLNFCRWCDAEDPWIEGDLWLACEQGGPKDEPLDPYEDWKGCECVGGLDLSGTRDLTALALAFEREDGGVSALVEFWTPKDTLLDRAREDRVPYDVWVEAGHMHAPPGRAVDYSFIVQRIAEVQQIFSLKAIAFDPYRIKYLEKELDQANVSVDLKPHPQGFYQAKESGLWMPRSIEETEKLIGEGKLNVKFNPCLRWNVASAVLEVDPKDNRIFTKRKSKGRIDGIVALAQAIGLLKSIEPPKESNYEREQLKVV